MPSSIIRGAVRSAAKLASVTAGKEDANRARSQGRLELRRLALRGLRLRRLRHRTGWTRAVSRPWRPSNSIELPFFPQVC